MSDAEICEVEVIGAGFVGLEVAKGLDRSGIDVTVIDRRNHHLFQPLLDQVDTAALTPPIWPRLSIQSCADTFRCGWCSAGSRRPT